MPVTSTTQAKKKGGAAVAFMFLLIFAGIVGITKACSGGADDDPSSPPPPAVEDLDLSFSALDVCNQFVEDRLKSPSTADFGGYNAATITNVGTSYTVQSTVDAQNSFGAMLRSNFTCTVRYSSASDRWTLVSLTGLD